MAPERWLTLNTNVKHEIPSRIMEEVSRYVVGREDMVKILIVALLCNGHILVEGHPGTAKTLVTRTFSQLLGGNFKRVQLTPDTLPGDITGFNIYRPNL